MMGLAGYAQLTGVFDWIAARAVRIAGTSRFRLFALVYATGIVTTAFFSNDATIVVLTPAVIGALRRYDASPVPYVVACALIANAASFVLPISNPSNLLVFASRTPALAAWLRAFALPSLAAVGVTFVVVAFFYRRDLRGQAAAVDTSRVNTPGAAPVALLTASAVIIVAVSAFAGPLGTATFACALAVWLVTLARDRSGARAIVTEIAWNVVALTATLFVIIDAIDNAGGFAATRTALAWCAALGTPWASLATGFLTGVAANIVNNLPVGLNLGTTLPAMHATAQMTQAALIGVNLGPNATVIGSLATLLWLRILKRNEIVVSPLAFARVGILATVPALAAALLLLYTVHSR
jgi:arsenical pump membrane protein